MTTTALEPIPILLYHAIGGSRSEWIAPFTVTEDAFRNHLELVAASGRTALTVEELRLGLAGDLPLPARPVVITFDDGFADLATFAAPLLAEYGMPCTVFVTSGFLGRRSPGGDPMLSRADLRDLAGAGHEVGAHSVTHPELDTLSLRRARDEVTACRAELEDALDGPVVSFAYPHGYSSAPVRRLVREAGYQSACGVADSLSHAFDESFRLSRLMLRFDTPPGTVTGWLSGTNAPMAGARERLRTKGWRTARRGRAVVRQMVRQRAALGGGPR